MDKKGFTIYLENKGLAPLTQEQYFLALHLFFTKTKKEDIQVAKPDILKHLEYLKKKRGQQNITRRNHLIALNHYFTFLYQNGQISENPCLFIKIRGTNKKKLHKIYTPEELDGLFDNYYQFFVRGYDDSRHRHEGQRRYSTLYRQRNALIVSILFSRPLKSLNHLILSKINIKTVVFYCRISYLYVVKHCKLCWENYRKKDSAICFARC